MQHSTLRTYPGQILGWRLDGRPIRTIAGGAPDDPPPTDPPADPPNDLAPNDPPADAPTDPPAEKVEDLPTWAQTAIRDARKQAGDNRTAKNAAEQRVQDILKAAGIKTDEDDPAKQLEAERKAKADLADENRTLKVERAAEKAGRKQGADVDELMDRSSFLRELKKLDPSSADFTKELDALVKETLEKNPKLKTGRAPGASSVDHQASPGEGRSTKPVALGSAIAGHYGTQ